MNTRSLDHTDAETNEVSQPVTKLMAGSSSPAVVSRSTSDRSSEILSIKTEMIGNDSSTGDHNHSTSATVPVIDSGTGDHDHSTSATVPVTDSGTGDHSTSATVPVTDSGTGDHDHSTSATVPVTDSGTGDHDHSTSATASICTVERNTPTKKRRILQSYTGVRPHQTLGRSSSHFIFTKQDEAGHLSHTSPPHKVTTKELLLEDGEEEGKKEHKAHDRDCPQCKKSKQHGSEIATRTYSKLLSHLNRARNTLVVLEEAMKVDLANCRTAHFPPRSFSDQDLSGGLRTDKRTFTVVGLRSDLGAEQNLATDMYPDHGDEYPLLPECQKHVSALFGHLKSAIDICQTSAAALFKSQSRTALLHVNTTSTLHLHNGKLTKPVVSNGNEQEGSLLSICPPSLAADPLARAIVNAMPQQNTYQQLIGNMPEAPSHMVFALDGTSHTYDTNSERKINHAENTKPENPMTDQVVVSQDGLLDQRMVTQGGEDQSVTIPTNEQSLSAGEGCKQDQNGAQEILQQSKDSFMAQLEESSKSGICSLHAMEFTSAIKDTLDTPLPLALHSSTGPITLPYVSHMMSLMSENDHSESFLSDFCIVESKMEEKENEEEEENVEGGAKDLSDQSMDDLKQVMSKIALLEDERFKMLQELEEVREDNTQVRAALSKLLSDLENRELQLALLMQDIAVATSEIQKAAEMRVELQQLKCFKDQLLERHRNLENDHAAVKYSLLQVLVQRPANISNAEYSDNDKLKNKLENELPRGTLADSVMAEMSQAQGTDCMRVDDLRACRHAVSCIKFMAQLESDTHETIFKQGFLSKQGALVKSWKKRLFVLDSQSLSYYKTEQPVQTVTLDKVSKIQHSRDCTQSFRFEVHTPDRVFYLAASSYKEMQSWIGTLQTLKDFRALTKNKDKNSDSPASKPHSRAKQKHHSLDSSESNRVQLMKSSTMPSTANTDHLLVQYVHVQNQSEDEDTMIVRAVSPSFPCRTTHLVKDEDLPLSGP